MNGFVNGRLLASHKEDGGDVQHGQNQLHPGIAGVGGVLAQYRLESCKYVTPSLEVRLEPVQSDDQPSEDDWSRNSRVYTQQQVNHS